MQTKGSPPMATFGRVAPGVPVADMDRAIRFYRDVLGFVVQFTNGSPISFAMLKQGDAELHLCAEPAKAGSLHAHLMVDDLDVVHERLKQGAATIRHPPNVQPWGLRDIVIADPDGNTFEIAEPVGKAAAIT